MRYNNATICLPLIFENFILFVFGNDTRWNVAREAFKKKNKGPLITNNDIK